MTNIKFTLNRSGGADILKNNQKLIQIENSVMEDVLATVEAQFFQTFGVVGHFGLIQVTNDRTHVIIEATDKQTGAILNANPGWLALYINNITI